VLENKIAFAQTLRILEGQVSAVKWHFSAGSKIFFNTSLNIMRLIMWQQQSFKISYPNIHCLLHMFFSIVPMVTISMFSNTTHLNSSIAHQLHTVTKFTEHRKLKAMHKNN
jgi:hypothetical protein